MKTQLNQAKKIKDHVYKSFGIVIKEETVLGIMAKGLKFREFMRLLRRAKEENKNV